MRQRITVKTTRGRWNYTYTDSEDGSYFNYMIERAGTLEIWEYKNTIDLTGRVVSVYAPHAWVTLEVSEVEE